jgi:hypothetical protein
MATRLLTSAAAHTPTLTVAGNDPTLEAVAEESAMRLLLASPNHLRSSTLCGGRNPSLMLGDAGVDLPADEDGYEPGRRPAMRGAGRVGVGPLCRRLHS